MERQVVVTNQTLAPAGPHAKSLTDAKRSTPNSLMKLPLGIRDGFKTGSNDCSTKLSNSQRQPWKRLLQLATVQMLVLTGFRWFRMAILLMRQRIYVYNKNVMVLRVMYAIIMYLRVHH